MKPNIEIRNWFFFFLRTKQALYKDISSFVYGHEYSFFLFERDQKTRLLTLETKLKYLYRKILFSIRMIFKKIKIRLGTSAKLKVRYQTRLIIKSSRFVRQNISTGWRKAFSRFVMEQETQLRIQWRCIYSQLWWGWKGSNFNNTTESD